MLYLEFYDGEAYQSSIPHPSVQQIELACGRLVKHEGSFLTLQDYSAGAKHPWLQAMTEDVGRFSVRMQQAQTLMALSAGATLPQLVSICTRFCGSDSASLLHDDWTVETVDVEDKDVSHFPVAETNEERESREEFDRVISVREVRRNYWSNDLWRKGKAYACQASMAEKIVRFVDDLRAELSTPEPVLRGQQQFFGPPYRCRLCNASATTTARLRHTECAIVPLDDGRIQLSVTPGLLRGAEKIKLKNYPAFQYIPCDAAVGNRPAFQTVTTDIGDAASTIGRLIAELEVLPTAYLESIGFAWETQPPRLAFQNGALMVDDFAVSRSLVHAVHLAIQKQIRQQGVALAKWHLSGTGQNVFAQFLTRCATYELEGDSRTDLLAENEDAGEFAGIVKIYLSSLLPHHASIADAIWAIVLLSYDSVYQRLVLCLGQSPMTWRDLHGIFVQHSIPFAQSWDSVAVLLDILIEQEVQVGRLFYSHLESVYHRDATRASREERFWERAQHISLDQFANALLKAKVLKPSVHAAFIAGVPCATLGELLLSPAHMLWLQRLPRYGIKAHEDLLAYVKTMALSDSWSSS